MTDTSGNFSIPDTAGSNTDLNTLFGVAQGVGGAPVLLRDAGGITAAARNQLRRAGEDVSGVDVVPSGHDRPMTSTLIDALQHIYTMDPQSLAELQKQLYAGGLYGASYYTRTNAKRPQFGVVDGDTYAAFKEALVRTARSGRSLVDVLGEAGAAAGGATSLLGAGPAPKQGLTGGANNYTIDLSNPEDIAFVAQKAAVAILGRKAGPDDIAKITAAIQGQERSGKQAQIAAAEAQQRAAYNAQLASRDAVAGGTSGADTYIAPVTTTTTAAPNTQAEAEAQLRAAHPTEAAAHDATSIYATMMSLIRGGGGA